MSSVAGNDLRALREYPFELLREIERRSRLAVTGGPGDEAAGEEWVGIGLRLAQERFVVPRHEVREVLMLPAELTRVPGAKPWIRGLANVRGHLLPVADLREFLGGGSVGPTRSARVLVANNAEFPVGLVVDEVYGFRRFLEREHVTDFPSTAIHCDACLQGAFRRGLEVWPVFSIERLIAARDFQRAADG
jgi:twitching motility protein PilI